MEDAESELLLFTIADGSTITSVFLPGDPNPIHAYRVTSPAGVVLGEFSSMRPLIELIDRLGMGP